MKQNVKPMKQQNEKENHNQAINDKAMCLAVVHLTVLQNHRITESQNHRMVGLGRDLCGSSSPTLLPKQGHLQ